MLFSYPLNSAYIIQKCKKLKKALLAQDVKRLHKKIAVLGGSTTNGIVDILELFLLDYGIEPEFYQSEYGKYFEDASFPPEKLLSFKPDLIYIHTTFRNILTLPNVHCDKACTNNMLQKQYEHFTTIWDNLAEKFHAPIVQNNFELPLFRILGNKDCYDLHGQTSFVTRLNALFYDYANTHSSFYINDINYISACFGLDKWHDDKYWYMYKYALAVPAFPEFAFNLSHIIKSIFGKNKKVLALDLDNTLWGGVVGEDGVDGIEIGKEEAVAEGFTAFQSYIKLQKNIGTLLTICSKNDEANALAGLQHRDTVLVPNDFQVIKANWERKDVNLEETASQLQLLPESFVFVDDNPAERQIIADHFPEMGIPDIAENPIRAIDRNGYFEVTNLSKDDMERNEMYARNAEREASKSSFCNYGEYLDSLKMEATIEDFNPSVMERITQLTNKSNQFNLTTKRYTLSEIQDISINNNYIRLYGRLQDKYGDNGIVSVIIGRRDGNKCHIDLWLMSCRVLKREMEFAMLDTLCKTCKDFNILDIYGYYYKTNKNEMVSNLYETLGFEKILQKDSGDSTWHLNLNGNKSINTHICIKE